MIGPGYWSRRSRVFYGYHLGKFAHNYDLRAQKKAAANGRRSASVIGCPLSQAILSMG